MAAKILGISGSPIPGSNTDKAVKAVLAATGLETEFIKLSQLRMEPCRACLGCVEGNECVDDDDARELARKFHDAQGFVLGAYTPYSSLDGRTKTFMERMYCLRHQNALNAGKPGAFVVTTACPPGREGLPPASDTALAQLAFWMMEEQMQTVGHLVVLGNVPCIRCGHGDDCAASGVKMIEGPDATVASTGVREFKGSEELQALARGLGDKLRAAVDGVQTG